MKIRLHFLLLAGLFLCLTNMHAQVGIGTSMPDSSAQLDVVAQDKGILIPRVALSSTQDMETISSGNVESLLVFNTASSVDIKPGYYYWYANRWHRVVTADDVSKGGVIDNIVVYDPTSDVFNYINESGDLMTVDLESLVNGYETLTSIIQNTDGTFTYSDERGNETVLDISNMETLTAIVDHADGTYTYTNEKGTSVVLNANTTNVTLNDGVYTFTDGSDNLITSIDTKASATRYDNINSGLTADNVQNAIDEVTSKVDVIENTKGDLIVDGGLEFIGTTNGTDKLLANASIGIADGGVLTSKLAADAVTNANLADDAVNTENIVDGAVGTVDLADGSVTAGKLIADSSNEGMVGVVQSDGTIVYQNISSSNVDGQNFTSSDLTITGGTGATLTTVTAEITNGAVDTDALAADAVTNANLADDAVNTENIVDGAVGTVDLADGSVTAGKMSSESAALGQLPIADGSGGVTYGNVSSSNVDGQDFTSSDLTITGGTGATLTTVTAEITDGAVDTDALAADAVTNANLADDAVNTENIVDGAVGTVDLADGSVTAGKLIADSSNEGMVGVVQSDGTIVYQNISSSNVDGQDFTSSDLTITGGTGATLTTVTAEITDGAVDTDALAADAVTNANLADDAVNTENIVDGAVGTVDLADGSVTAGKMDSESAAVGQVPIADGSGGVTYGNVNSSNVDGQNFTSDDLTITGGDGATLTEVTAEIKDGAVDTAALADNAVTNSKLADDAVDTANLAEGSVTAVKMDSESAAVGQVPIADGSGGVTYGNVNSSNVDGQNFTSDDLTITGGDGATLTEVTAEIKDGAVDTAALADNAVTNSKLADDAVDTANLAEGSVTAVKMDSESAAVGQVPIADGSGGVTYGNVNSSNVDGQNFTSDDLTITGGDGATLTEVTAEIKDGAVDTAALADNAVTNSKLADDAVDTANLAEGSVTAVKMDSESAAVGQVPIADGSGGVTYGNVNSSNVDGQNFTSDDLTITGGDGATLTAVTAEIKDGAVDTAALADNAVTNSKLADDAVDTENIVDGAVGPSDLNANVAGDALSQDDETMALNVNANNGLTIGDDNVQLGGTLIGETSIVTNDVNTLAIEGLQTGEVEDQIVVVDPVSGVLRQSKAAMPKFFYMPSIVFDVSTTVNGATRNLHEEYIKQFTGTGNPTLVGSVNAPADIPNLPDPTDLYYYVTYYDTEIFEIVSISETGLLTYNVKSTSPTEASFMNIVFVVK